MRALNLVEAAFAAAVVAAVIAGGLPAAAAACATVAAALLAIQIGLIRPGLRRRSDRVLAGGDASRSHAHLWYVAFEVAKVLVLVGLGTAILTGLWQVRRNRIRGTNPRRSGTTATSPNCCRNCGWPA